MAEILDEFGAGDDGPIVPILEFAERLAQCESDNDEVRNQLKRLSAWVERNVKPRSSLVDLRNKIKAERNEKNRHRIVIDVSNLGYVEYWLYSESELSESGKCNCENSPAGVRDAVMKLLDGKLRCRLKGEPFFEFSLPFENLLWEIDHWEDSFTYTALGNAYPVVLRWRERHTQSGEIVANWRRVSEKIKTQSGREIFWLPADDAPLRKLYHRLRREEYGSLVGFSSVPDCCEESDIGKTLFCVLRSGVPYAFWPRKAACNVDVFKEVLSTAATDGNFHDFPARIQTLRNDTDKNGDHPCAALSVLWDDPDSPIGRKMTPLG
jgi:hypothetical protein